MSIVDIISSSYIKRDKSALQSMYDKLLEQKKELEVFFEEYLEVFDEKMNASIDNKKTPEWKCYNDKYKLWEKVNSNLKLAKHYLGMI